MTLGALRCANDLRQGGRNGRVADAEVIERTTAHWILGVSLALNLYVSAELLVRRRPVDKD
jgi:hypothetical protein